MEHRERSVSRSCGSPTGPDNVLRFLASQPDLDQYLASLGLPPEHRELPADVLRRIEKLRR